MPSLTTAIETPGNWRVCIAFWTTASTAAVWDGAEVAAGAACAAGEGRQQQAGQADQRNRPARAAGVGGAAVWEVIDRTRRNVVVKVPGGSPVSSPP